MSPEGRPVRCGGWAMNEIHFDPPALAELISRRWQENRGYSKPNTKARGAWLEGSGCRQPDWEFSPAWVHCSVKVQGREIVAPPDPTRCS